MTAAEKLADLTQKNPSYSGQIREVFDLLIGRSMDFSPEVVVRELTWFYSLGFDEYYYQTTPVSQISKHVQCLYAAKLLSKASKQDIHLERDSKDAPIYACACEHDIISEIESKLESKYPTYRLQCYKTNSTDEMGRFMVYFLKPPQFEIASTSEKETDLEKVGSTDFLKSILTETKERYQNIIHKAIQKLGVVVETSKKEETNEIRFLVCFRKKSTHSYFGAISHLLNFYKLKMNRKYIEQFSNGLTSFSIYIDAELSEDSLQTLHTTLHEFIPLTSTEFKQYGTDLAIRNLVEETSMLYVLPRTSLSSLFHKGQVPAQAVTYAYAAWKFVHLFLSRQLEEYKVLKNVLKQNPVHLGMLARLRKNLRLATYSEGRILDSFLKHPEILKELYNDFAHYHASLPNRPDLKFDKEHNQKLGDMIIKTVSHEIDQQVFLTCLEFNRHIVRTNFYKDDKVALSFRLEPSFLNTRDYPETPYGIYFLIGSEFRGFHVRFRDVARGGIRIIRSRNDQVFAHNANTLFDENYNLAHTQQRKNKDIPEGGSKGTILLSLEHQDRASTAFKKYINSLLDLMLPDEEIVDYLNHEELLFLGPDEGTADLMDWASHHAQKRNYKFYKAFTTGKSVEIGGIPHDLYGMTTLGVHQYVLGVLQKMGIDESSITKIQTGGPDGDLGSNEILVSRDKTIAVVDGSGVLFDPLGISREELSRLAKERQMVVNFDTKHLGKDGFLVSVTDKDISLPDGTLVESGLHFRNEFHVSKYAVADLFLPCGGRPESINISNVKHVFDKKGQPKYKYIIEGANLFLTQEARVTLEEAGVIIYKDASANKGGVTSSSLEVLAALALSPEEFDKHMQVKDGVVPDFYDHYVKGVHKTIIENARLEFECIWREHERTGLARTLLTDYVSEKINRLNDTIQESSFLWKNAELRRFVMKECSPETLLDLIGLEKLFERVPDNYLKAIFSAHLASRYIYKFGMDASEIAFFEFIQAYFQASIAEQTKITSSMMLPQYD